LRLVDDTIDRKKQLEGFARLDEIFGVWGAPASERAAQIVMEVYENKRKLIGAPQQ
jgi:hypothetical protein